MDLASDGKTIVTGGADKIVQVFDLESSKVLGTLKGHTKAVTHVAFREDATGPMALSSSTDKHVRLWGEVDGSWSSRANLGGFKGDVTGLSVHPSGAYVAAASTDSTWQLFDLETATSVATYSPILGIDGSFSYTSFQIHPDGILNAGGTKEGTIRVWDARQSSSLAATLDSHSTDLTTMSFSENGYYLASASSADPTVNIIDLRKLAILSSWRLPAENTISEVRFDPSAHYLSVAGTDLRVYANKKWDELYKFEENAGLLTGARFGKLGAKIVLSGMDRTVRVLGAKSE